MSLKDLLRTTKGGTATNIASVEQKIAEAQEWVITSQKAANASALDAESGDDAAVKWDKRARAALMDAQDRLAALSGALHEAKERQQLKADIEAEEARLKGWRETEKLANQRHKLATDLQVGIENLEATFQELLKVNTKQVRACPDMKGAKGGTAVIELLGAFRLYFVKHGMKWAQSGWVWGPDKIKPLVQVIEESNTVMLANQDRLKNKDVAA
jgi:hypothetical protein